MKRHLIAALLLAAFAVQSFSAVLTDDDQVVIPTGQPIPTIDHIMRYQTKPLDPQLILAWHSGNSSIVLIKDELAPLRMDARSLDKDLRILQKTLEQLLKAEIQQKGKSININMSLE